MNKRFTDRLLALLLAWWLLASFAMPMTRAEPGDTVTISTVEDLLRFAKSCALDTWSQGKTVVLAFYKPAGVTCTERDPHAETKVSDVVKYPERVTYAGRLDKDSEGLLLLSNDGDLIQAMMRGVNCHEKEYLVQVDREIGADFAERMARGVYLKELGLTTRECTVEKTGKYTFRIVLTQGVNRQIKRMCMACGYTVTGLKRVRVMHVTLGELKPGEYRELGSADVERLYRDCGLTGKG